MPAKKASGRGQRGIEKRQKTIRKRQDPKKQKLIAFLQDSANIGVALKRVGIDRSTYSRWRASDLEFASDADDAIELGIENTADLVETCLLSKARDGDVQAQKYYLTNNHERYREDRWKEQEKKNVLTEEMKRDIANAAFTWAYPSGSDELDEDYESGKGYYDDDKESE